MLPEQVKAAIRGEYLRLVARANRREINHSCIENLIRARCQEGARHNNMDASYYLPDELKGGQR